MMWNDPARGVMRIKICGVRCEADIEAAAQAGVDAIGLVLAPGSIRHIDRPTAARLARFCEGTITPVCLLVDPGEEDLRDLPTEWVQLHGGEDDACIARIARSHKVIKAVPGEDLHRLQTCDAHRDVSRLLVDAPRGGSGSSFDHDAFARVRPTIATPLVIAGGLDDLNVAGAIDTLDPWGVDVSSGVESAPGHKDPQRIARFCRAARS